MTRHRSARSNAMAFLVASLLSTGCSLPEASALPLESARQSAPDEASFASPAAETAMPLPPEASVAVEGGDPVVGQLGSFAWQDGGSDSPWIPGSPIHVGAGETMTLSLAIPVDVTDWSVRRTPAESYGDGIVGMAEGYGWPVTFGAPPAGTWSVNVDVWFADDAGSASYFWLIEVD